jgi:citrate synthase
MGNLTDKPELNAKKGKIGNLDSPKNPFDYMKREYGTVPLDTKRAPFQWVSEVAYKNVHRIVSRGYDTSEVMEEGYGVVDMLFIDYQARIPLVEEEQMLNYVMILALEDGLSMPAVMSRMVARSKTFLTQAAGASILAFGHAYGAYSAFGDLLTEYLARAKAEGKSTEEMAGILVKEKNYGEALGYSDLMLKDPAAKRIFARAEKLGVAGEHVAFMKEIVKAAQALDQEPVDLDLLGATGATMMDLGFTPEAMWTIIAVTRSYGAGAHFIEEVEREGFTRLGETLTPKEDYDGPEDRPVPPLADREKSTVPAQVHSFEEWSEALEKRKELSGSGFSIVEDIEDPTKKTRSKHS